MANLYRVIYTTTDQQHVMANVSATTQANAVAKVKTDDSKFKDVVSVTEHIHNHSSGS